MEAEGGYSMSRRVTSPTGHGPAVFELSRPRRVVAATASIQSPAAVRESNKLDPLTIQKYERQSGNRTGTGTPTTLLRPRLEAWAWIK